RPTPGSSPPSTAAWPRSRTSTGRPAWPCWWRRSWPTPTSSRSRRSSTRRRCSRPPSSWPPTSSTRWCCASSWARPRCRSRSRCRTRPRRRAASRSRGEPPRALRRLHVVVGDLSDLLLDGLVLRALGEGQQAHELAHVAGDLDAALHEGGVGVEVALLDPHRVVPRHGEGELGVDIVAQLRRGELAALAHPVVADVALRAAGDVILHAGGGAGPLGERLRQFLLRVEPGLREVLLHGRHLTRRSVSGGRAPAGRRRGRP